MNPIRQEDGLGCAAACVAFILQVPYLEAVKLFIDGERRVKGKANFYCPEITQVLNNTGLNYTWTKLSDEQEVEIFQDLSIVFVKRSVVHPYGHFLVKYDNKWMDPWINLPDKNIEAGFREYLPGEPAYSIYLSEQY